MSCCCPEKASERDKKSGLQYDDLKSGASAAPTTHSMKRGAVAEDDTSDIKAVDWWRTRSQETNQSYRSGAGYSMTTPDRTSSNTTQPMQLTPEGEYYWAAPTPPDNEKHADASNRMATVESIEVDELSAVQEDLKRREIQDFVPIGLGTQRAPSLPIERTRTEESAVTDESSLNFKLVEHEEEELDYPPRDDEGSDAPAIVSPAKIKRKASRTTGGSPVGNSLHDLRQMTTPIADAEMDDYLDAADKSVDIDVDELDQIVLGVRKVSPQQSPVYHDDVESNRVEDLLTRRKRKSPNNVPDSKHKTGSVGHRSTPSPIPPPTREPASPNRPPKPEEAAAAAAAAASQLRAPSPMHSNSPRLDMMESRAPRKIMDEPNQSLSAVPSSVDSDTRDRYLLACRLLKATLIEKDPQLQDEDKEFLRQLLTSAEQARAPSEHDIAAIETASDLLSDTESEIYVLPAQNSRFRVSHLKETWQRKAKELFSNRPAGTPGPVLPTPGGGTAKSAQSGSRSLDMPALTDNSNPVRTTSPRASPFIVLGKKPNSPAGVLTQPLMEALRGFFPYAKADENFLYVAYRSETLRVGSQLAVLNLFSISRL